MSHPNPAPGRGLLKLPPVPPANGPEREAALRCLAFDVVTQLGPSTSRYLAALIHEVADELDLDDGAVHAQQLQEEPPA